MSKSSLSVAVLVSAGAHPVSGAPRACPGDAVAMAVARQIGGAATRVIHAGQPDERALRDYLALGALRIEVVPAEAGCDIAPALASVLADADLVLTGARAERGAASGLLPYMIAKCLDRPIAAEVLDVSIHHGEAHVLQFLPRGKRRRLAVKLPAVLAVHPLAAVALAYAYARKREGHVEVTDAPRVAASQARFPQWTLETGARQIVRLKADERKSAQARLEQAIATERKGGLVVADGTPAEKARALLAYLRENRLIDY